MITSSFIKDLKDILNRHSIDSLTDIPDDILAEYIAEHIGNLQKTLRLSKIKKANGQHSIL
jgi:hypothetical protein